MPYPDEEVIGRFEGKVFDPERWKPRAPTAAFLRARPDDAFWAARRVAAFPDEMIYAITRTGEFSDPLAAAALAKVLVQRRDAIARTYLPAVNPIVDVALSPDGALTFANAAVDAKVAPAPSSYAVEWARFDNATGESTPLGQRTVVTAPRAAAPAGLPTEPGAYVRVRISAVDGPRAWATPVAAYLRRTGNAWTLVGLERQPSAAVRRRAQPQSPASDAVRMSASSVARESASLAGLSFRHRSMRGKRTATPERCRVDGAMASKPSSNTWIGSTCRTGPKRSTVWRRIQRSISRISSSVRPE